MHSQADYVASYLEEVPEQSRAALAGLRALCVDALEGYEESMEYRMPSYKRPGGKVEVAFASQANHISLYIMRPNALDRFRDEFAAANLGKGCIRYSTPAKIDFEVVNGMLEASAKAEGPIC